MTAPDKRVLVVYGTRPEAIKLAPLVHELRQVQGLHPVLAVTGQHRSMLDQVNELFDLTPDFDLDIASPGQTLSAITAAAMSGLDRVLTEVEPEAVVVQGDTTTTFAGALAGFYHRRSVVHLEAGLRTGDRHSPYPEEINRLLTTRLTDLHLAATAANRRNLIGEGIPPADVVVTGNTIIDALAHTLERGAPYGDAALAELDSDPRRVLLVTAHRRESWGAGMRRIGAALAELAQDPELVVVVPVHKNPGVRDDLLPPTANHDNVIVTEPLDYGAFCRLLARADVVLTDSGGIQEEAPSLGKPVLVMRDITERHEALEAGTARLVGTQTADIVDAVRGLFGDPAQYASMATAVNPYGDGKAARRAGCAISELLGLGAREPEFRGAGGPP